MTISRPEVERVIHEFLVRVEKVPDALTLDLPLYAGGIGLDSLETAELSVVLEDAFGSDPYAADDMPQTVGDIVAFFDRVAAGA